VNVAVVVVRYFGGTLLGVPGLINAYKTAAALSLQVTPIIHRPVLVDYRIEFDYMRMNEIMQLIKRYDCSVHSQELNLFCQLGIGIPKSRLEEALSRLEELQGIRLERMHLKY
jgi:putative IMPACT (imprinted ancient) family translation regulator